MRQGCGAWDTSFVWLYAISNAVIFCCYFGIASIWVDGILRFDPKKPYQQLPKRDRFLVCAVYFGFILSCGVGHLMDGTLSFLMAPMYHFLAIWHALTATVSIVAVVVTWRYRQYLERF